MLNWKIKLYCKYGYFSFALILFMVLNVFAQKEPQYTQYMYNIGSFNPAYVGTVENIDINLMYRAQWLDIEGAPRTIRAGTNIPLSNNKHGIGFNVVHDEIGPSSQTYFDLAYSYQVNLSDDIKLSFGMDLGGALLNVDFSKGTFESPEPILGAENINKFYPTIGAGLFLYGEDVWYLGVSTPNFLTDGIYNDEVATVVDDKLQLNLIGGYVFNLSDNLKFKPAFLINYLKGAPFNANVSTNFLLYDRLTLGASYRVNNAFSGLAGVQISEAVFFGFSYDYNSNGLGQYNNGTPEFLLKFSLGKGGPREKRDKNKNKGKLKQIDSPRFF